MSDGRFYFQANGNAGFDDSRVWPHILGMSATIGLYLS
jgi:hypothetical protein